MVAALCGSTAGVRGELFSIARTIRDARPVSRRETCKRCVNAACAPIRVRSRRASEHDTEEVCSRGDVGTGLGRTVDRRHCAGRVQIIGEQDAHLVQQRVEQRVVTADGARSRPSPPATSAAVPRNGTSSRRPTPTPCGSGAR